MTVHPRYHPRPRGVCLDHVDRTEVTSWVRPFAIELPAADADAAADVQASAKPTSDTECGLCWAVMSVDSRLTDHAADCLWRRAAETTQFRTLALIAP